MVNPAQQPEDELPRLPTSEELPCEDGVPLETSKHRTQMEMLIGALEYLWRDRDDFYVGGNMFLYFSLLQTRKNDFRGPDFFVVLGTERRARKSWVMWEEEQAPDVIVEITSPSTRDEDHHRKKHVYGRTLRVPYYFIHDPETGVVEGFRLEPGSTDYVPLEPTADGRLRCERLGLELGVWGGTYRGVEGPWLRWHAADGALVPLPEEVADQQTARAEQQTARAEQEAAGRRSAEARIAELEAQVRALRGD